jgi:hypothetical protein
MVRGHGFQHAAARLALAFRRATERMAPSIERAAAAFARGCGITPPVTAAPLHAICPACLTRLRVPATRLGGRLRRHGGCSCRAAVADAVRLAALDASERAEGLRYRAAVRRTVAQGPRGWRPGDLRAIGRWEDRAAVLEHRALRLREWVR